MPEETNISEVNFVNTIPIKPKLFIGKKEYSPISTI